MLIKWLLARIRSLIQPRADGRLVASLSLQDKALLRKYSISGPSDGLNIAANARLVQNERHGLTIRSEGSQRAEDILKVDQTDPTVFDSIAPTSAVPLVPIPSSPILPLQKTGSSQLQGRLILRGDEELEKLVSRRNRERMVKAHPTSCLALGRQICAHQSKRMWSPRSAGYSRLLHCTKVWRYRHGSIVHYTGLGQRAIPAGFLAEFQTLEYSLKLSSRRSMNLAVGFSDAEAERLLMLNKKQRDTQILNSSAASDQLVLAAELKPRRFRSNQRIVYEGPTARKDLENAERSRWVASLGDLLRHTDTPMGRLMRENPSNILLLGSGLREFFALSGTVDKKIPRVALGCAQSCVSGALAATY